ncbi:hypothetical protein SDJN02_00921, partial [Cucurbita argyrosperma subsp. argyrosperma]
MACAQSSISRVDINLVPPCECEAASIYECLEKHFQIRISKKLRQGKESVMRRRRHLVSVKIGSQVY